MREWLAMAVRSELPPAQMWAIGPVLGTAALFYGVATRIRNLLYDRGLLVSERLPVRVVCVGGLTVGGTGKTPLVIEVARILGARGLKVAVVSRGYGRSRRRGRARKVLVVADADRVLVDPEESGDEPALIAGRLPGVPVVVGARRVEAGRLAIERFAPDVILLDDGFQHRRLARDLDIVTWDERDDPRDARLLPRGALREPLSGLERGGMVLVKSRGAGDRAGMRVERDIRAFAPAAAIFRFRLVPECLTGGEDERMTLGWMRGRRVLAVSGIARPAPFTELLRSLGAELTGEMAFPDHHSYGPADLDAIRRASAASDAIVTTEKDLVRLEGFRASVPCLALRVRAQIREREDFERGLLARVLPAEALRGVAE